MAIRDAVTRVITPQKSKVWHKLALVAATLVLPVTALNWLLMSAYREQITFAKQEVAGEVYLQPVRRLTEHLIEHRALAHEVILGDASARKDLLTKQAEIDDDMRVLSTLDQEVGDSLGARTPWAAIRAAWPELRKQAVTLPADRSLALHNALIGDVLGLIAAVADASNLRFDPIPVGFYLTDTMINRIPAEANDLGRIRDLAVTAAASKRVRPAERAALLELIGRRAPDARAINENMKGVFRGFAQFEAQLKGTTTEHLTAGDDLVEAVRRDVLGAGDEVKASPEDLAALGNRAIATGFRLYDEAAPGLNLLLKGRIDEARRRILVGALCSVVGVLLTLLIGLQVSRGITRQVRSITDLLGQIGIGNFEARANITSADELGDIASSLNSMLDSTLVLVQSRAERDTIQASIMKLLDEVSGVAEGDLTREAEVTEDVTGAIADSFNYMILQLRQIISDVQDATLQVGTSANEIHSNTERLVLGSQTQAEKIFTTSTAIEEIALSIQQVSDNAVESAAVAQQALANATQGNEAVQNTIQGMTRIRDQAQETAKRIKRLGESSQEIGQIIQLIDDIADRTSILALNASIQAAAAGEAGRGFAVVAEEVERLAERSTDATKKIATLIKTIQSETNEAVGSMEKSIHEVVEGSKLANQAGQALGEIGSVSSRLAQLIQSISQASKQQARGSEAVAKAMSEISEITQDTTEGTRQAAEAVSVLAGLAEALRSSVSTFRLPGRSWQPDEDELPVGTNGFGHEANGHDLAERINARSGEFRRVPAHV